MIHCEIHGTDFGEGVEMVVHGRSHRCQGGSPGEIRLPAEVVFLQNPFRFEAFNARLGEPLFVPE